MSGWVSPEATAAHEAVSAVPRTLQRRWSRSVLGQARVLQQHQDQRRRRAVTIVRLETFDAHRGRLPGGTVRFSGRGAVGLVSEGDWLEATGWRWRGIVRARRAYNHSTGAVYAWIPTKPAVAAAAMALVLLVATPVMAAMRKAGTTLTTASTTTTMLLPQDPIGTFDGTTTTTEKRRSTDTTAPETKPVALGDPNSSKLPAEHQSKTIGPPASRRVRSHAAEKNVSWAGAAKAEIGDVARLEGERRAAVVAKAPKVLDIVRSCLADQGATWDSCTAASIGSADDLAALRIEHRLAVISDRPVLVDWMAGCLDGGETWAACSLRLMGKVSDKDHPYTYEALKDADPKLVDDTLTCVEQKLPDHLERSRWVACAIDVYAQWEKEQGE